MLGGLDSIGGLPSSDLGKDRSLVMGGELAGTSSRKVFPIGKAIFEDPGYSRLANTSSSLNFAEGKTSGGKGDDVLLLSVGDGMHDGFGGIKQDWPCLYIPRQGHRLRDITVGVTLPGST